MPSDIYLMEDREGGNLAVKESGDIQDDGSLQSLCYLLLFNGSTPLNVIRDVQYDDEFEKALDTKITPNNLTRIEQLGDERLSFLVDNGFVDSVSTIAVVSGVEKVSIKLELVVNGGSPFYITFAEFKAGGAKIKLPTIEQFSILSAVDNSAIGLVNGSYIKLMG